MGRVKALLRRHIVSCACRSMILSPSIQRLSILDFMVPSKLGLLPIGELRRTSFSGLMGLSKGQEDRKSSQVVASLPINSDFLLFR